MIDIIVVVDTETSDLPENGGKLMEVGWVACAPQGEERVWTPTTGDWSYVEFEGACSPEARAVHHIPPEACLPGAPNCLQREVVLGSLLRAETDGLVYAAHNAPFDAYFLQDLDRPWIDTLQCARHVWPDAPRHGNQVLRYWRDAVPPAELLAGLDPHRAMYDAACTAALLCDMLRDHSPEELVRLSTQPILQKICNFGNKHRGQEWRDVPRSYMAWIRDKTDVYKNDPNIRHTIDHYLSN